MSSYWFEAKYAEDVFCMKDELSTSVRKLKEKLNIKHLPAEKKNMHIARSIRILYFSREQTLKNELILDI